jgi:hypothetical protein
MGGGGREGAGERILSRGVFLAVGERMATCGRFLARKFSLLWKK